jgi:hypothetical protein
LRSIPERPRGVNTGCGAIGAPQPAQTGLRRFRFWRAGPRPRINSVLTYGEHPGMKLNELTQKLFYGRTA